MIYVTGTTLSLSLIPPTALGWAVCANLTPPGHQCKSRSAIIGSLLPITRLLGDCNTGLEIPLPEETLPLPAPKALCLCMENGLGWLLCSITPPQGQIQLSSGWGVEGNRSMAAVTLPKHVPCARCAPRGSLGKASKCCLKDEANQIFPLSPRILPCCSSSA